MSKSGFVDQQVTNPDPPPQYTPVAADGIPPKTAPVPYPTQQGVYTPQPVNTDIPVARFNQDAAIDPNKPIHIPPPPPGYAPTPAQQAAAQGGSVHVVQDKKDMWGGGSDGGVTIW